MRALIENKREPKKEAEQAKIKLDNIQKCLSLRIVLQRKKLLHRLSLIKLAHERKRSEMKQNIMSIRRSANEEAINSNKVGDANNCLINIGNEGKMRNYCTMAYSNQGASLIECRKNESFCALCCDHEFGDYHNDLRNSCLKKCDDKNEELNYSLNDKDKSVEKINTKNNIDLHLEPEELSDMDLNKMLDSLK